ncbi:MBL fold metallo-hydrolase [Sphingomonas sp. A2-49]|uniref:MBL fold metallo-hydrolase n=1 Tax=Sphingomonas sp. A2-49 TaxID=1391375 RepID=UPI0021CF1A56|nr:MBL fold metallo-hydrolase [Sphingomonas sp. A2-49]MCU6453908.1 MBL fold metallo-hydrolase [Sphingomonas sp. A2-49]
MTATPVPSAAGIHAPLRHAVGDYIVTALSDGHDDLGPPLLVDADGATPPGADRPLRVEVNAFLIQGRGRTVLVDTGAGHFMAPTLNRLAGGLHRLGVTPSAIDTVLLTHLHPDHAGGLVDAAGAAVFDVAEIRVHARELGFWDSDEQLGRAPAPMRPAFHAARAALAPYRARVAPFEGGDLLPGIVPVPLFGHTPGHCGFLIDGGGSHQLLIWGDIVHRLAEQIADPDIGVAYDTDGAAARIARRALCDRIAADALPFTGMHVPFPQIGTLTRAGSGFAFRRAPASAGFQETTS